MTLLVDNIDNNESFSMNIFEIRMFNLIQRNVTPVNHGIYLNCFIKTDFIKDCDIIPINNSNIPDNK